MLLKYPLPEEWKEVYDAGVKRHYYWNQQTDEVTWLPPRHPAASAGSAAQELAKEFFEAMRHKPVVDERGGRRDDGRHRDRVSLFLVITLFYLNVFRIQDVTTEPFLLDRTTMLFLPT